MWHPWKVAGERYPHIDIVTDHRCSTSSAASQGLRTSLIELLHSTRDPYEIADELWCDAHAVRVRLDTLDPIEVTEIEHALDGEWLWIP